MPLSMNIGHRIGKQPGPAPIPRSVAALLRRKGAAIHLPGADGEIVSGFHTGNYTDSVGTTPATIDGKTGLVVDAAGTLGPELVVNGDFSNGTAGWTGNSGITISTVNGALRAERTTTTGNQNVQGSSVPTVAGKSYRVLFDVVANTTTSAQVQIYGVSGTNPTNLVFTTPGKYHAVIQANGPLTVYLRTDNGAIGSYFDIDNISVRELTGNHALQATDGYKPVERRGLVNLQTYSTPTSGQWIGSQSGTGVSPVVTYNYAAAPDGTQAARVQLDKGAGSTSSDYAQFNGPNTTVTIGNPYSTAVWMRTTDGVSTKNIALRDGVNFTTVQVTGQWQLFYRTATPTGSIMAAGCRLRGTEGTDQTADILIASGGLFQGTVTAQQIIAAGGIPVTTDAPKSSSLGPRYWQFDGVDDRLQLSAVPFQMSDDFVVVTPASASQTSGAVRTLWSLGGGATGYFGVDVLAGLARISHKDDAGVQTISTASLPDDTNAVVTLRKVGTTAYLRINGVQVATMNLAPLGSIANQTVFLFCARAISTPNSFHNGKLHGSSVNKGPITDAELLLLERFAASCQGRQL